MAARKVLDARVAGTQNEIPRHPRVEPLTVKSFLHKKPSNPNTVTADATLQEALKLMLSTISGQFRYWRAAG